MNPAPAGQVANTNDAVAATKAPPSLRFGNRKPSSFEGVGVIIIPALYPAVLPSRTAPPLRSVERFRALRVDCCA